MSQVLGDQLNQPPTDCITSMHYSTISPHLLVSSWDQTLRLYNVSDNATVVSIKQRSAILDCVYPDNSTAYCGLLTGAIRRVMLPGGQDVTMGLHDDAVRCLDWISARALLVSGSWDKSIKVWDPRSRQPLVKAIPLPGRVFAMSSAADRLVVGTSGRLVLIYDVRKFEYGQTEQQRESSLKFMTRCVSCYPDGRGYALGSVEGRVAMELFDLSPEIQATKYAFKCHRRVGADKKEVIYPVHCIRYHKLGTFATGGGDGVVNFWDGDNKKRLFQITRYPTSISALAFSPEGQQLAVASSYCWEEGEKDTPPAPTIFLRPVADSEIQPKVRPAPA